MWHLTLRDTALNAPTFRGSFEIMEDALNTAHAELYHFPHSVPLWQCAWLEQGPYVWIGRRGTEAGTVTWELLENQK